MYKTLHYQIGTSGTNNKSRSNSEEREENKTNGKSIGQSGKDDTGIVYTLYISQYTLDTDFYIHIKVLY